MKKITIKDISDGCVLARDVVSSKGQLLFSAGSALNRTHIEQLSQYKIREIFIEGRDIPSELEFFDSEAVKRLENQIEERFRDSLDNEVMQESLRVAKKIILERALRNGQILTKSQLNLIARLKDLPALPQIYVRLAQTLNDPRATAQQIASLISADPVMSAKLLKLVNSSFYNFPQKITSVANAVSLLGFDTICNMVLSSTVIGLFRSEQKAAAEIINKIWEHSLGVAIVSRLIARKKGIKDNDDCFIAGLLHDIGKIIIAYFFVDDFNQVWDKLQGDSQDTLDAENDTLGYTHVDAGSILAEKWELPELIIDVIKYHHKPYESKSNEIQTAIVHTADVFSLALNYGDMNQKVPRLDSDAWKSIGMGVDDIEPLLKSSDRDFEESRAIFFLQISDLQQDSRSAAPSRRKPAYLPRK
ncbi:HDOD domain-containing protein [bacterium]|nr:HDOD domain-containing protein [FCB group bacterium]MBL7192008.1 HDOD domain-containing protein [bacterium]